MARNVKFTYLGGTEIVMISGNNWNISIPEPCYWLKAEVTISTIVITAQENAWYEDRSCTIRVSNSDGLSDTVEVYQDGYRNMVVDIQETAMIPYTYYEMHDTYDIPIRIYGGNGTCTSTISKQMEQVYDSSDLYNDFMLHITEQNDGEYTFIHSDIDKYIEYCEANEIPFKKDDMIKTLTVKNVTREMMDGFASFTYNGVEYMNTLPPIYITSKSLSTLIFNYGGHFNDDMEYMDDNDFDVTVTGNWAMVKWVKKEKRIYLKANSKNPFSDRNCILTLKSKTNPSQVLSTTVTQRKEL